MKWLRQGPGPAEMPFLDHLEELRTRLIRCVIALMVGAVVGFVVTLRFDLLGWLIKPVQPYLPDGKLMVLGPGDGFFLTLRIALIIGVLLALPIIIGQIWAFVSPALHDSERRAIVPAFYLGLVLFAGGVALAYFAALPVTLEFFSGWQADWLSYNIVASNYLGLVIKMLLAFGLVFELPVVVLVLTAVGVVDSKMLASKRRHAIVIDVILASLITPGDVIILTIFLMIPLILLYELGIVLAKIVERRREARLAELEAELEAP